MEGHSYGVFLSFSRWGKHADFIHHLYTRLKNEGVRTFRDEEDLPDGEENDPSLPRVIEQSKILIPVFSKNYASSRRRLNQLAQMVGCWKKKGRVIMPIFYHVEPSEVQRQTGDYGEALLGYENKKGVDETIRKWKAARNEVGGLTEWIINDMTNGNEGEVVREVVNKVLDELKKPHLVVSDFLVGGEKSVEEVLGMIGTNTDDVKIVGIHGMGGIGKTTLAKIVYNKLSLNFDYCCFLDDVRETSHSKGIVWLQNQLISQLFKSGRSYDIPSTDQGIRVIQERLSTTKVLIFLDDVDKTNQLTALLGRRSCFGPGSRILITTRNANVLHEFEVMTYLVDGLDFELSLQLFSKHAFGRDCPPTEKMEKSTKLVKIAHGLPLALEVMGSFLSRRSEDVWDDFLVKFEKYGNEDITRKLEISYDALDVNQKQIFLDIACLFAEYDKSTAIGMWIDCGLFPTEGLKVLQSKSLIKIRQDNKLWMHSQHQDLGKKIVSQKSGGKLGEQSRLLNYKDSLEILLQKKVEFSKPANTEHSSFKGVEGKYEGNEGGIDNNSRIDDQLKELNSLPDSDIKWRKIGTTILVSDKVIGYGSDRTTVYEGMYGLRRAAVKSLVRGYHDVTMVGIQKMILADGHENIVRYHGKGEEQKFVYLALERCICSLDDLIRVHSDSSNNLVFPDDSPTTKAYKIKLGSVRNEMQGVNLWSADGYPSPELLKLMSDVVSGLSHLHSLEIFHLDIKPQNVLITKNPSFGAKLSDLGISKCHPKDKSSLGNHANVCGTKEWQAPEQHSPGGHQIEKMDMFSLGCVLFFCVTRGKHPFGDTIDRDSNIGHDKKDLSRVEFIPEAHDLISLLLHQDPTLRSKASEVRRHPFFWSSYMRLKFLHDVSDKVEAEAKAKAKKARAKKAKAKKAKSVPLKASGAITLKVESEAEAGKDNLDLPKKLEEIAQSVFDKDWTEKIDNNVMKVLRLYRDYDGSSVNDLLRAVRNKINHHADDPNDVKNVLGSNSSKLDAYFTERFPRLLIESYNVVYQSPKGKEFIAEALPMLPK